MLAYKTKLIFRIKENNIDNDTGQIQIFNKFNKTIKQ